MINQGKKSPTIQWKRNDTLKLNGAKAICFYFIQGSSIPNVSICSPFLISSYHLNSQETVQIE